MLTSLELLTTCPAAPQRRVVRSYMLSTHLSHRRQIYCCLVDNDLLLPTSLQWPLFMLLKHPGSPGEGLFHRLNKDDEQHCSRTYLQAR